MSPLHGLSAGAIAPVAGLPVPELSTWPSWLSCTAWVSARRTATSAVGPPGFSLNHSSPSGAYTDCEYRLVSRWVSEPTTWLMLAWPLSSSFAAVVMFETTLRLTVAGRPTVAEVAPPGPQV